MFSALESETQKQLTKILVLTLALLRPETTLPHWLQLHELFRCQLWRNAEVKDEKIKLCEKWPRPQALEGKSSKKKTVRKWNILLSIKHGRTCFENESNVKFELQWLCMGIAGQRVFQSLISKYDRKKKLKTVCNVHVSKNKMKVRQVLIRREDALLHSSSSAPQNSPALPRKPECDTALPESIKYEWPLIPSYTTRPQYLAHDDLCQEDSPSFFPSHPLPRALNGN